MLNLIPISCLALEPFQLAVAEAVVFDFKIVKGSNAAETPIVV